VDECRTLPKSRLQEAWNWSCSVARMDSDAADRQGPALTFRGRREHFLLDALVGVNLTVKERLRLS